MAVEAADDANAAISAFCDVARRTGSRVGIGGVAMARARWEHEYGQLEAAQESGQLAVEIQTALSGTPTHSVRSALAAALLDAGELNEAEQLIADVEPADTGLPICGYHSLRGRIQLGRGRAPQALADLERQLAVEEAHGWIDSFRNATRVTLVTALAEVGRLDEARALADAELTRARTRGLHGPRRASWWRARGSRWTAQRRSSCSKPPSRPRGAHRADSSGPRRSWSSAARCAVPTAAPTRAIRCVKPASWRCWRARRASKNARTTSS